MAMPGLAEQFGAYARRQPATRTLHVPIRGFAPDLDPLTPGILVDTDGVYPTVAGVRAKPSPVLALTALPSTCLGAYYATFSDGSVALYAGTASHLYKASGSGWTAVDGGATYTASRWTFDHFGDDVIAVAPEENPQVCAGSSGTFSDLGGTPAKASLVGVTQQTVFLAGPSDLWQASAPGTDTTWTPSLSTLAASGHLKDTPGAITAIRALRNQMVFFKADSLIVATFSGLPNIWTFTLVSGQVGTSSPTGIVEFNDLLAFLGPDDFYLFDGAALRPIPNDLKQWLFARLDRTKLDRVCHRYDQKNGVLVWYVVTTASTTGYPDRYVAWNYRSGRWATGTCDVEMIPGHRGVGSISNPLTYGDLETIFPTYGDFDVPYGWPLFAGTQIEAGAQFGTDHALYFLTGPANVFAATTGDLAQPADPGRTSLLRRVRPRWGSIDDDPPVAYQAADLHRGIEGAVQTVGDSVTESADGWFNLRSTDRFHAVQLTGTSGRELVAWDVELVDAGIR